MIDPSSPGENAMSRVGRLSSSRKAEDLPQPPRGPAPGVIESSVVRPHPPDGYELLNVHDGTQDLWAQGASRQINHLIIDGRPSLGTLCGQTLFGPSADIRGWSRGGGVFGVPQVRCDDCWNRAVGKQP